jgi:hypothetical protein
VGTLFNKTSPSFYSKGEIIMLKRTITYKDYNGLERTEDFFFNLSEAEITEMEITTEGGLAEMIRRITAAQDMKTIMVVFKDILLKSYGEKSPDGRRFVKSPEISKAFSETEAYSILFMQLVTNQIDPSEFVSGLLPEASDKKIDKKLITNNE